MKLKEKNKQNFQGEVKSGFIIKLEKLTLENIELGRQSRFHCSTQCGYQGELLPINSFNKQQKERGKYDNIRQSKNLLSKN